MRFSSPRGFPPGALLIPSGSPPPWPKCCRTGGSSDVLFAHSMKPPVIPVRSGNFIYSCVAGTSVCFFSQPAFVCCHLRSRRSQADTAADCRVPSLLRVVQALLSQVGPPARTWGLSSSGHGLPGSSPPLRLGHAAVGPLLSAESSS